MSYRYFPHTPDDIRSMLDVCGVNELSDLYADVPENLKLKSDYALPSSMSEHEVRKYFMKLAAKNQPLVCFAGGGYYDHYSPSVIPYIISRSEYLTAYTPYQPEISQGTLQYIFEYQSMMADLTGMDVSNASMYDGSTATAEAMMMSVAVARKKNRVLVSETVNPAVRKVLSTYAKYHGVKIDVIPACDGVTSKSDMEDMLQSGDVAGVVVQSPNCFGIIEDYTGFADAIHARKALLIMNVNPSTLAVLKTPGEWGADVAVGDAQSLGIPMSYGGPSLGFMCVTKSLMRKIPGRIVGATTDALGQRAFVLTLQAREQHIRREKATSNICSNQSLMALFVTVYMSLLGPKGLYDVNAQSCNKAHALCDMLTDTGRMNLKYPSQPFFNEMVMECDFDVDTYLNKCTEAGVLGGIKIGDRLLMLCATETVDKADMESLVEIVKSL